MKKIKILLFVPALSIGGAERQIVALAKNINKKKFEVYLGTVYQRCGFLDEVLNISDVTYVNFDKSGKYDILVNYRIYKFIKRKEIDIFHSYIGNYYAMMTGVFLSNCIVIGSIRRACTDLSIGKRIKFFVVEKYLAKFSKAYIISNNRTGIENYLKNGYDNAKMHYIPNGISKNVLPPPISKSKICKELNIEGQQIVIGFIGRLVKEKGLTNLLLSAKNLVSYSENIKIVIVGDGILDNELKKFTNELDIEKNVIFTGMRKDIENMLNIFDVFCLPSLTEGFPNVILEAIIAGIPVVATNVGQIDLRSSINRNCFIVPPNDHQELTKKLQFVITNYSTVKSDALNARERVFNEYSAAKCAKKHEHFYEGVVKL